MRKSIAVLTAPLLLLAACEDAPAHKDMTGITAADAEQLNRAADMLDVTSHPPLPSTSRPAE